MDKESNDGIGKIKTLSITRSSKQFIQKAAVQRMSISGGLTSNREEGSKMKRESTLKG